MLFQLEFDDVSQRIVRQIHRRVDHVRIASEDRRVLFAQHRLVVLVPNFFGNGDGCFSQLSCTCIRMCIEPLPHTHIYQRNSHDFIKSPEDVKGSIVVYLLVVTQKLEVAFLEDECQCFGKSSVRHTVHGVVVDVIEVDGLLYIMAEFVYRDVITLIVHTFRTDSGTQK